MAACGCDKKVGGRFREIYPGDTQPSSGNVEWNVSAEDALSSSLEPEKFIALPDRCQMRCRLGEDGDRGKAGLLSAESLVEPLLIDAFTFVFRNGFQPRYQCCDPAA